MRRLVISGAIAISVMAVLGMGHHLTWWTPGPPRDPGALVLRIDHIAGMGGPGNARPVPAISLYGNGRLVTTAMDLGQTPAREIIRDQRLTRGAYERIYRDAHVVGLGTSRTFHPDEQILDGGLTKITFLADGRYRRTTVDQGTKAIRPHLIERLAERLRSVPRDDLAQPTATYRPARLAVFASRTEPDEKDKSVQPWPLRPLSETCAVLTGPDVQTASRLAGTGTSRWRSGTTLYSVSFRPLLPDENDCTALRR